MGNTPLYLYKPVACQNPSLRWLPCGVQVLDLPGLGALQPGLPRLDALLVLVIHPHRSNPCRALQGVAAGLDVRRN